MRELFRKIAFLFDILPTKSRMGLVVIGCVIVITGIVFTLARYTILDHDFYKNLADSQQLREVELAVNRGTIYATLDPLRSSNKQGDKNTILATTSITQDLSIDPSGKCNRDMLQNFLVDIVYQHLCLNRSQVSCYDNILKFTDTYILPDNFNFSKEQVMGFITPTVHEQVNRIYKTRIQLATNLSSGDINALTLIWNPGLFAIGDAVYVDPTKFDRARGLDEILRILALTPSELEESLELRKNRNVDIVEKLDSEISLQIDEAITSQANLLKQQPINSQDEFAEKSTFFRCLKLTDHPVREYPVWPIASQLTGFVDRDGIGRLGIEWYFHDMLSGKSGKKEERRDSLGRPIFDEDAEEEVKGVDLYLTVDANIQTAMMQALQAGVNATGANTASAIVMDPQTGAIRAIGSYPSFDPERPGNVEKIIAYVPPTDNSNPLIRLLGKPLFVESSTGTIKRYYENKLLTLDEIRTEDGIIAALADPNNTGKLYIYENNVGLLAHQDIPLMAPYEPGSIFKWITTAIGLDSAEIEPDMLYEDRGKVMIDNFPISNLDNTKCQWWHTFRNAMNYSCNIGMINIVQRVGKPLFYEYLRKFWFADITGLTLDGEHTGTLDTYEKWAKARLFTISFGQGIQVNLVQMAAAYAALANGGVYMQPYVVQKRVYPDGDTVDTEPIPVRRVISRTTSQKIIAMLTDSARFWFAKAGWVPGYDLAGKTGTSQIASIKGWFEFGEAGRTNTSYAGFGPSLDPKFVILVRFDRPKSTQYAEFSAAKTFKDIATFLVDYYGIPPKKWYPKEDTLDNTINPIIRSGKDVTMPLSSLEKYLPNDSTIKDSPVIQSSTY